MRAPCRDMSSRTPRRTWMAGILSSSWSCGYRHRARLAATDHQHADGADRGDGGNRHEREREAAGLRLDPADQVIEEEAGEVAERVDLRQARRSGRRAEPFRGQRPERALA